MSAWLPVEMSRSLSSLGYVLARAGGAAGTCCCGGLAATAAWAKVFAFPLPFPDTSTQLSAWIRGALDRAGVLLLGGCCGLGGCCISCAYFMVVWLLCALKCWPASKLIPPGSAVRCAGGASPCGYSCAASLGCTGAGAGIFCGCPASCCSLVTPTLILLHSSARKPIGLVVEACFSARPMIWVWREWMAARIAVMMSRLVGSWCLAPSIRFSTNSGSSMHWLITCAQPSVMMWLGWFC